MSKVKQMKQTKMNYSSSESEDVESDAHISEDEDFPLSDREDNNEVEDTDKASNWANALKKVLKTKANTDGRSTVLSKAKKADEIERIKAERKGYGFEIEGEVKEQNTELGEGMSRKDILRKIKERREIRENLLSLRVKPTFQDREREKALQRIGTKGIVQLFNAVRAQQKDIDEKLEEAGKPEYKREKVLKSMKKKTFLDALMNGPRAKSELVDNPVKMEPKSKKVKKEEPESDSGDSDVHKSMWTALKDDFITNNKNWDKSDNDSN